MKHRPTGRPTFTSFLATCPRPKFRSRLLAGVALGGLLAVGQGALSPAQAQTCTWNTGNGSWNTPADWSTCNATFPGNTGAVGADATVVGAIVTLSVGNLSAGALTIGNTSGTGSEVDVSGSSATSNSFTGVTVNANSTFALENGASVSTTGGLGNAGTVYVDAFGGDGGSSLGVGGTLTNSSTVTIGNTGLTAATNVTAASLANTGTINLDGSATDQAALKVAGAAGFGTTGEVTGQVNLQGDTLLQFGSGGLTAIASTGQLQLKGSTAQVQIAGNTSNNNALTGLTTNAGNFILDNGASVSTTGGLANSGAVYVDAFSAEGGSSLGVGGTLTNSSTVTIGNTGLTAATTVTAASLANTGIINLDGSATDQAALKVAGAAGFGTAGEVTGQVNLQGDTLLQFGSGGLTAIASTGQLQLSGSTAQVQIAGNTSNNNALAGLATNAGNFFLDNGASVTTTGGLTNSGNVDVDVFGADGGSSLGVGGTLANSSTLTIGNTGLTAATNVTAASLANTGIINLDGSATDQAALKVAGAAGFGTAGEVTGQVNLQGDTLVQFGSGGLTSIASTGQLQLSGSTAQVQIAGNTSNNNALAGLATNAGNFFLDNGASVTTTGGLTNSGNVDVDVFGADGGSSLGVGGTLANSSSVTIGNTGLTAATTVTAASLANTGIINLDGSATNQAALKVAGAAGFGTAGSVTGQVNLQGDTLVQFGSGGLTSIASGGRLQLNGSTAQVQIAGNTSNNNALTGLATNAGNFFLGNGASVTTTGGVGNSGNVYVDALGGEGGSSLGVGGTLTNSSTVIIGNPTLSAATTVTAQAVDNTGIINLDGSATDQAALKVAGAAGFGTAGEVTGQVNLQGDTLVQFGSGGLTAIASTGQLQLSGSTAQVQIAGNTSNNNALAGLATNAGNFFLDNGASVSTTGGLANSGNVYVDLFGGEGGSSLGVGGTLTNSSTVTIGNTGLTAATNVTAASLANTGSGIINLNGNSPNLATLTVNGPAGNSGDVNVNAYGKLAVAGGNNYTQTAGTTTVAANGALNAANVAINGGTLQGTGTVTGNVFNSATVTGGANTQPGALTINGNFLNAGTGGSPFGATPGTVASYLSPTGNTAITVASGSPTLQGGTIQGNLANGESYAAGQTFTVMNFTPGSLTGVFGAVQNGSNPATLGTSTSLPNDLTLGVVYNDHAGNIELEVVNTPAVTADIWNGGTGNWNTAANWSAGVPQFFSNVGIGATSSGYVTLGQDATIETLAINSGNTLAYQATTPATLSVGGAVTVSSGGALDLPTSGDKVALGGNFFNSGTTTLGGGASLYGLGSFANTGSGASTTIGNGASVTTLGAASNGTGATIALAGGSLTAPSFTNAGTVSGFGTVNPGVANTGLVEATGGTLAATNGIQGTSGNITVDSGATLDLSHSTAGSSAATLAQNGALNLGSQNLTVSSDYSNANFGSGNSFNNRSGVTGTGQILAAGNVAQAVTGSAVTNGTTASPTLAFGNVHVGTTNNTTYAIGNTGTAGPSLRGAIQTSAGGGNITDASLSGSGVTAQNFGPVATGTSTSPYTVTYAPTASGALTGQAVHIANNFSNVGEQTLAITGAAYNYANPTVASSLSPAFNFGVIQVGQTYTDPLTISNVLVGSNAAYQEGLNASFGSITNAQLTASGSITNLAAGQSNATAMAVTLKPVTAGATNGTVTLNFASNGSGTSGLGTTTLSSQDLDYVWNFSGIVVNPASPSITPNPVDFGNVRIHSAQSQALSVANVATTAPQASLDAQVGTLSGAATSNNLSSISQLAAGSTDHTSFVLGLNTATAGAESGSAVINLQSDSTPNGCTSNCIVNLPSDNVAVSGNVYRLANPTLNTSSVNLAARVGGTAPSANVSVTNTSPDAFTEGLAAGFGAAPAGFSSSGSIANLAAGGTDSATLNVALNTGTAGTFAGNAALNFTSNGQIDNAAPVSVGSGNVALTGNVYTPAQATVNTANPINFGIVHVGDGGGMLSQSISVSNSAPVTALNDTLLGSVATSGSPFSGSGSLGASGLAAGQTSTAMAVGLSTANAGIYSGSANLSFASHDSQLADLALPGQSVGVNAQVNRYAALAFLFGSGAGTLTGGGNSYTLDLGDILQNPGATNTILAFLNDNPLSDQAFTDLLSSSASILSGSGFSLSGDSVTKLAGGLSQSGFDIGLDTSSLGNFNELLNFEVDSSNPDFNQTIGDVTLTLTGSVVSTAPVPEPASLALLLTALVMLGFVGRLSFRRAPK